MTVSVLEDRFARGFENLSLLLSEMPALAEHGGCRDAVGQGANGTLTLRGTNHPTYIISRLARDNPEMVHPSAKPVTCTHLVKIKLPIDRWLSPPVAGIEVLICQQHALMF